METRIVSMQVGMPKRYQTGAGGIGEGNHEWYSAFGKQPVEGQRYVHAHNIDGDGQADLKNHGGPDKAVLCYAASHYPRWHAELGRRLPYGGFGENFTIAGLDETTVCIGDVFQAGTATFQVSQMRGPCWKISAHWGIPELLDRVKATGRTGWYLRVLEEGYVEPGQSFCLVERSHPKWTIARVNDVCEGRLVETDAVRDLLDVAELSSAARRVVEVCLRRLDETDDV
ncbi:MOSC domain-containing protein [Alicyclobacillus hesperidum subsp. aegles]|uniref:MOSC domain-containing protein n=1 Tax=Alicyclobacillus hesperidum TaxID=89784 RepID=UPI00222CEDF2|nr:MOSC domain-containing protein [Alicyclobacillus hesperidum]GLG02304.1 MOSC domain-containing protein [Alicyclobacillus hesperidum subsp. aegles]